ncbi:MAG: hypothetical protein RMJ07_02725 [Nitrososphaerota archaeon]|nr:hypothetical protein [Candidatus Bathyarchaeota archaeon]MDW8048581.1 hypothetical protein [Nitrososphaerota archaeon]
MKPKTGLSWRIILAMVTSIFLFIPVNIYSYFITGVVQGSVAVFFITLVFSEIVRLTGSNLSRQEVLILYYAAAWGGTAMPIYYNIIYRTFFVNSPLISSYSISGRPLIEYIPTWLVPLPGSYSARTFFQPAFLTPLIVWFVWSVLMLAITIFLSIMASHIYVERLNYPFPYAVVDASIATFLGERPREYVKYFIPAFTVGVIFGSIAYLPLSFGGVLIPIPYLDLTGIIEEMLPGALLGLVTVLSSYFGGLIVPVNQTIPMLISSILIWIIMNSLFITTFPGAAPEWVREYSKGMGLIAVQNRSYLRIWFAPQIGFTIAASAFLILFEARKPIVEALKEMFHAGGSEQPGVMVGLPSLRVSFLLWLLFGCLSVVYFHILVPEVSLLIPILYVFLFGFFIAMVVTAFRGETGFSVPGLPGWTWHTLIYFSPYQGYAGFILEPPAIDSGGPAYFSQQVKASSNVGARPRDLLIVWVLGYFLSQLSGLISLDFFWRIAPIPSSAYPFTVYSALSSAYNDAMIVSRQLKITLESIGLPALALFVALIIGDQISRVIGLSFPIVGLVMGLYLPPHSVIPLFIGSLVSRYLAPKLFGGAERWRCIMGYIVAGELSGEGLMLMLNVVLALMYKSAWMWPW